MNRAYRHRVQRERRTKARREAAMLLDRVAALATMPDHLVLEVAEMRLRLAPPPGVAVPARLTNYTGRKN